jgi:hypothetical protein
MKAQCMKLLLCFLLDIYILLSTLGRAPACRCSTHRNCSSCSTSYLLQALGAVSTRKAALQCLPCWHAAIYAGLCLQDSTHRHRSVLLSCCSPGTCRALARFAGLVVLLALPVLSTNMLSPCGCLIGILCTAFFVLLGRPAATE